VLKGSYRFFLLIFGLIIAALAGVGFYHYSHPQETVHILNTKDKQTGVPALGGGFQLMDTQGTLRTEKDFLGRWVFVYFGYTFCPDICPTALYHITQAIDQLGPEGRQIQPLFITIDPERDTQDVLRLYIQNFHKSFVMLTGKEENIQKVMKKYRVYSAKIPHHTPDAYLMDHSSIIYVMDPSGQYATHFNHETPPADIVKQFHEISENWSGTQEKN
jgi:protein SCO1/2